MDKFHKLDEASLARAYQHIVDKKVPSWGIASAYRYANTAKENERLTKQMKDDVRKAGLGFFVVKGHWRECQDDTIEYGDCPSDKLVDAIEETLFIPKASKELMANLATKYNQDSTIYGGKDTKGNAVLIGRDGEVKDDLGKFNANTIGQAYSEFKNKQTFHFKKGRGDRSTASVSKQKQKANIKKLSSMIPTDALDKRIKNPDTGRMVKVKTALGYDKTSKAYKSAFAAIKKPKK